MSGERPGLLPPPRALPELRWPGDTLHRSRHARFEASRRRLPFAAGELSLGKERFVVPPATFPVLEIQAALQ